ncbi:hypothetical protein SAMN06265222_107288 [Neorhodopirellula lusitana]|uniref:Doubled CXXCH motif (Paired_CXXCH_1) n=1 Tax=Neorhodopirellula lusitana TaxID=445327 RepID=A0ABY1Q807_9BACT|nr:hypothetical protein [Neorhodopirellula lusitana]SMP62300.1 hypothetical protein SAMN06265222_107288 [Neorhodopirellula lusitana]
MRRDSVQLEPPPRLIRPSRRGPLYVSALLVFTIGLIIVFNTSLAPHVVKPGPLTTPHAQILEGTLTQDRCSACHANVSASGWSAIRDSGHANESLAKLDTIEDPTGTAPTMTDRCVACHHRRIAPSLARSAHNLSSDDRLRLTQRLHRTGPESNNVRTVSTGVSQTTTQPSNSASDWLSAWRIPDAAVSQDDVACAVCHREHHGAMANLSDVTDQRCQTCHTRQFGSFATSHPPFEDYPPQATRTIAFDHAKHANVHFPKTAESQDQLQHANSDHATSDHTFSDHATFDCRSCHAVDMTSPIALSDPIISTLPFEVACASCHDESLQVQLATGPALIALPTLPREVAIETDGWPEDATGSPDGELSAWMRLLLAGQSPELDLEGMTFIGRVDWDSPARQQQAIQIGNAIRKLAIDLSTEGQTHLKQLAIQAGADEAAASTLARSFQPQLLRDAVSKWFGDNPAKPLDRFSERGTSTPNRNPGTPAKLAAFGDDDLLTDWSQEPDPLALPTQTTDDVLFNSGNANQDSAAWKSDLERRFDAARTQTLGGWYRDDLTMSLRYRGTGHSDAVIRTLIDISSQLGVDVSQEASVASCQECHQSGRWNAAPADTLRDRLTKFTHRPHLDVQGLQNCQHCHQLLDGEGTGGNNDRQNDPNSPNQANTDGASIASLMSAPVMPATVVPTPMMPETVVPAIDAPFGIFDRVLSKPEPLAATDSDFRTSDFKPITKQNCAACHTSSAAGDRCTTCHRYHVGDPEQLP